MKANLVCKGGGVKGVALVGALACLEENGYEWGQIAGTSVGAIIASLVAVGYTAKEIKDIMDELDFTLFRSPIKIGRIPIIGQILSMVLFKGLYNSDYIETFLEEKFKAKGKTKFKDVGIDGMSRFKAIASDVTKQEILILPDGLAKYGIDPMEFELAKAVRMSISIPFYYCPIKLKEDNKKNFIVDGGLISNFPVWLFDDRMRGEYPTVGLNLLADKKEDTSMFQSPIAYLLDVIQMALYTNEEIYFSNSKEIKMINIPTFDIKATDFELTKKDKKELYDSGYEAAVTFIKEARNRMRVPY
ncbi:MAG: patatin-like phospholipase family protein [Cellulosilyticaceae bacterium]